MLPKLVVLNMLALLMMRFEHEAPARNHTQLNAKPSKPLIEAKEVKVAVLDNNQEALVKKTAVAQKRFSQKYPIRPSDGPVVKTRNNANTPMGCCFRGNLY